MTRLQEIEERLESVKRSKGLPITEEMDKNCENFYCHAEVDIRYLLDEIKQMKLLQYCF